MFKEIRETYVYKYSSPFAAYLADGGDEVCGWGDVDGPGYVSWIGGRHVLIHQSHGFVEHVHIPAHDGLQYLDRPAKGADVTGAYVWAWIEEAYPSVAAWEMQPDDDDLQDEADEPLHVTMTLEPLGPGSMVGSEPKLMNRYNVTLQDRHGNVLVVPFFTGLGWTDEPTIGDVLECLASDLTVDSPDEAEDLGLGIRAYLQLKDQNDRVRAFFGDRVTAFMLEDMYVLSSFTGTAVTL